MPDRRQRIAQEILAPDRSVVAGCRTGLCLLALATTHRSSAQPSQAATLGILAALGAGLLWGTMYIPYRKAYISGMNPLSFVTVFTVGELSTVFVLSLAFGGGYHHVMADLSRARPALFWLFVGGFCWVLGDLFQQYAAKYIGIGRGIPLSNTNQLWGLAWGALVFGELSGIGLSAQLLIIAGSLVMIAGALAISFAEAPAGEQASWHKAMERECDRYGLNSERVAAALKGEDDDSRGQSGRRWWEWLVGAAAIALFVWLGLGAQRQAIPVNLLWMALLIGATLAFLLICGLILWRRTRFS